MTELTGTFTCPICGQDTPHHHTPEEVAARQPTVAGVIAECRAKSKHYGQLGSGETISAGAVGAFFDSIADRLERVRS
jgi:hypothetical protein